MHSTRLQQMNIQLLNTCLEGDSAENDRQQHMQEGKGTTGRAHEGRH